MVFDYNFGKKSKQQIKRNQLAENRSKGKAGEEEVRLNYILKGYEVERRGGDMISGSEREISLQAEYQKVRLWK